MRRLRGALNHRAGLTAEACVAAHCESRGQVVLARRWRGDAGEIDMVLRDGGELVFMEIKKSRSIERAAARMSPRQIARIQRAALQYLECSPEAGQTPFRFDVALVDGTGRIEILRNALGP
ncbi:MAG: YraN family protein [Alkalilacustris sp.]